MSKRFIGNIITSNPQEPTENFSDSVASGTWSLQEAFGYTKAGVWPTAGNARPVYIEDVFSTYLYTGNDSSQTITNGIDLAGEGGLIWTKARTDSSRSHYLVDTERPINRTLTTSTTNPQQASSGVTSITSTGYTLDSNAFFNTGTFPYVSWTFRKAPRFFDVVSWTGNGSTPTINHNLGIEPSVIIIKALDTDPLSNSWFFWHKDLSSGSFSNTDYANWPAVLTLNSTSSTGVVNGWLTNITSNSFRPTYQRETGVGYVAYLFAHDPLGPSGDGSDGLIQCGSYTHSSSTGNDIDLGWEPQWLLVKSATSTSNWYIWDTMRGWSVNSQSNLQPNLSNSESTGSNTTAGWPQITSTGFRVGTNNFMGDNQTYIYMAIRRGPMRVPESGAKVFAPVLSTAAPETYNVGFPLDAVIFGLRDGNGSYSQPFASRIAGKDKFLITTKTDAETTIGNVWQFDLQNSFRNGFSNNVISYNFRCAPSFFDVVIKNSPGNSVWYHNLATRPDMIILKRTNSSSDWWVIWCSALPNAGSNPDQLSLNRTNALTTSAGWFGNKTSSITDTTFSPYLDSNNYIAYLFATCPNVSKIGNYTGNGSSQTIDCGFTSGARFVMIKRYDGTGDWHVWDTARGIVTGNDPYLELNTIAAEDATTDSIDPDASGFIVNENATTAINTSGANYIFMAIS